MSLATSWKTEAVTLGCSLLLAISLCAAQSTPATSVSKKSTQKSSAPKSSAPKSSAPKNTQRSSGKKSVHKTHKGKRSKKSASWRRGQQKIDPERARSIQEALIREHYLDGEPSGIWDPKSQKAMEKFQADNGWQSKMTPDSRALIKLGLGPNHDHLLNPDSAMTSPIQSPTSMTHPNPVPAAITADPTGSASRPQQ